MSKTGETPGIGTYTCSDCGELIELDNTTDKLPPCPVCGGTTYNP